MCVPSEVQALSHQFCTEMGHPHCVLTACLASCVASKCQFSVNAYPDSIYCSVVSVVANARPSPVSAVPLPLALNHV